MKPILGFAFNKIHQKTEGNFFKETLDSKAKFAKSNKRSRSKKPLSFKEKSSRNLKDVRGKQALFHQVFTERE